MAVPGRYMPSAHERSRTIEGGLQGEDMRGVAVAFGVALAALALPSQASDALAKKHNCLACHATDKKLVGPSYKDVAAKYAKDPSAEAKLVDKVKKGGQGVWGQIPMPPNAQVPDADVQALVKWILSQK
jgi:cytochrome c